MGAMTTLFGGGNSDAISAKSEKLTAPTDASVITPLNPGKFSSIRSVPVITDPRYATEEEAEAMQELATDKKKGARNAKKVYKAATEIEESDAKVHKYHRDYQKGVATNELKKKRADVGLAKHLHGLRPGYARLGFGLEKAETNATARIEEIKTKLMGASK